MAKHMDFKIRKFDMEMIRERCEHNTEHKRYPIIVFVGKPDTGKSFLVKYVTSFLKDFPIGTVISATEAANAFYQKFIPGKLIKDKYEPSIVEKMIQRQVAVTEACEQKGQALDPRGFLILDDCLYDKSWINEESTRYIFMNGRHINMVTMITMQYPLGIPPVLRGCITFTFILRDPNSGNRKRLYENYAGMFPTEQMFYQFMDQCTEDYNCLVIANGVQSNKLEDQVFWFKAPTTPPFKMCDESLWRDNQPFVSSLIGNVSEYDPEALRKKNKGPWIHVKKDGNAS